ncbi:hypothetical protein FOL47_000312 [Perkinsus chesapeaki]|uniref:Uncharacterized protein n=1 Tax=Perkinsus chesapeaki TaxID=330153 RepID=A0A7J6KWS4_PERCH|nr:hypothetical protein FOL47_000312 [Perkinsus chesapeaki]
MSALDDSSGEPLDYLAVPEYTPMLERVVMNLDPLDGDSNGDSNGDSDGDSDVDFGIYLGLDRRHRRHRRGCERCVHRHVESALHRAEEEAHKRCEHPKCPYMEEACEEALKNKKALRGYLFVKLRAGAVAEAYCTGAQRCHERQHADLKDSSFDTTPAITADDLMDVLGSASDVLGSEAALRDTQRPRPTARPRPGPEPSLKCITKETKKLFSRVQERLDEMCDHPESHKFERFCEFRHEEPQEAAGMVYAYVEPYKYAMGYCMAAK